MFVNAEEMVDSGNSLPAERGREVLRGTRLLTSPPGQSRSLTPYHILSSPDPFAESLAPKLSSEKTELRYHTPSQLGQLPRELRLLAGEWTSRDRRSSFPAGTARH
jgi:hypothetical protein